MARLRIFWREFFLKKKCVKNEKLQQKIFDGLWQIFF